MAASQAVESRGIPQGGWLGLCFTVGATLPWDENARLASIYGTSSESQRMNGVDPAHLAQLLDHHGPALELFARQWCHAPGDVVQEAFLRLVRQSPWPENVVAWLYTVVRNGAISASRGERRRVKHEQQAAESARRWFASAEESPLDVDRVAGALQVLPIEEREVIVAHLWGGRSFEEIAKLVGTSSSTAHRRYQAGLFHLKELLEEPCQTANPRPKNC